MIAPLDSAIAQLLPALPPLDFRSVTPQSARESLLSLTTRAATPPPAVASVVDTKLNSLAGSLPARVYRNAQGTCPTVVFFHGGGWVAGDLETHDRQARRLAIETGAVVVSVDYRRPPETIFPGAFDDCFASVRDVLARIAVFGGDATRVAVAGDSAGGNLAAAVAIACRDAGIKLAAQLLIYPAVELKGAYADATENARFPSRTENADGYFLTGGALRWYSLKYLADAGHGGDWRASPLRAASLAGLAPAVVSTAWFDPLRDEGNAYAEALRAAGVPTRQHIGAGLIHGYFGLGAASEAAKLEVQRVCADFKTMLG